MSSPSAMAPSLPIGVVISYLNLLVVAALRAGERAHFSGAEGGDYGCLVEVENVAALLALLPECDDRTTLVHYLAPRNLYRHCSLPKIFQTNRPVRTDCTRSDPPSLTGDSVD